VVVVGLVEYPLSIGPACWFRSRDLVPEWADGTVHSFYTPFVPTDAFGTICVGLPAGPGGSAITSNVVPTGCRSAAQSAANAVRFRARPCDVVRRRGG